MKAWGPKQTVFKVSESDVWDFLDSSRVFYSTQDSIRFYSVKEFVKRVTEKAKIFLKL